MADGALGRWLALPAALGVAAGLELVARAQEAGVSGRGHEVALFWAGLVLLGLGPALVALAPRRTRAERLGALLLLGLALLLVKVMVEPLRFKGVDELQQLRSVLDLRRTDHLYGVNPLVGSYARFPGITATVDGVATVNGGSVYAAGIALLAVCRAVLVSSVFLLGARALGSGRAAAAVTLVYITNPSFLLFGTELGYESMALPLAVAAVLAVAAGQQRTGRAAYRLRALGGVLIAGVVVTHHMTALWLCAVLLLWVLLRLVPRRAPEPAPVWAALLSGGLTVGWVLLMARAQIVDELGPTVRNTLEAVQGLAPGGSGGAKALFEPAPAQEVDATLLQLLGFGSVLLLLLTLPLGLLALLRRLRGPRLLLVLGLPAALYPVTLVLRLTSAGTETATRSSEFLFLGLGVTAALTGWVLHRRRDRAGSRHTWLPYAGVPAFVVLLVGGVVVGTAPYDRVQHPYRPSSGVASITPPNEQAALWAGRNLPGGSRVVADQANRLLMGSYGGLRPQLGFAEGTAVGHLLLDPVLGQDALAVVQVDKVDYVVADHRVTQLLPGTGNYVDANEPDAKQHRAPVDPSALDKFIGVPGVSRVFDNGVVRIYDVSGLIGRPAG